MGHSLQERIDIMLERMELNYGPNRVRRMTKEQFDKIKEQVEKDEILWKLKMKSDAEEEHIKFLQGLKDAE